MKMIFSKVASLLLLLVGIALIGQFIQCPYICSYIAKLYDGSLDVGFPGSTLLGGGIIFLLIGGYSLIPSFSLSDRKYKILKQNFDDGYAEINTASIEKECVAMLKRVAPLKQVVVNLIPEKENRVKAEIKPVVVIDDEQNLPAIEKNITTRLEEFLNTYFGIELSKPVIVKIDEFQIEGEKIYHLLEKSEEKELITEDKIESQKCEESKATPSEDILPCLSPATTTKEEIQNQVEPTQCESNTASHTPAPSTTTGEGNNYLSCREKEDSDSINISLNAFQEPSSGTTSTSELSEHKEDFDKQSS